MGDRASVCPDSATLDAGISDLTSGSPGGGAIEVEFDVPAWTRDGVKLLADVYRPGSGGPWPTLLTRTPYGKHVLGEIAWSGLDPVRAARRGFLVVVQDVRGRFASEGEWDPLRFERLDGFDSIQWASKLPGSNGRVGMFGGSYCGNTQWMPAIDQPPALHAISPLMTWAEPMDGLLARRGAVELGLGVAWSLLTGFDHLARLDLDEDELQRRGVSLVGDWDRLGSRGYWDLPVGEMAVMGAHALRELGTIRALTDQGVTEHSRVSGSHERVHVSSLHTAGWHDLFLQGSLDNYQAMISCGRDARLVVGPWTHDRFVDPIGEQVFGALSGRDGVAVHPHGDWNDMQLAWFRRDLLPDDTVEFPREPVRIFVMGRNQWRDESSWPLARAEDERWFLQAERGLSPTPGDVEAASEFTYDPGDPVPTLGGPTVLWPGYPAGPRDQARIERRGDVLVFTSDPLQEDLEVTGRVRVFLHVESSVSSTDWVARLCDVHPDGRSFNLCDGILRVSNGANKAAVREIDLWSTSNVFLRGHCLRVQVTSSSFPRWDRNLNTGNQGETKYRPARQRVHHGIERRSYILLPVVK